MKTMKKLITILIWVFISNQAFSLIFTSTPINTTRELDDYFYEINVSGNNGTTTISCEKKPDWLTLSIISENIAEISGVPLNENFSTNGDSIVIKATDSDTTVYQRFVLLVDYVSNSPQIIIEPDTIIQLNTEYSDTLVLQVEKPNYLEFEIIELPNWLSFSEINQKAAGILKKYVLKGKLSNLQESSTFPVNIKFKYASSVISYTQDFIINNPSNIQGKKKDSELVIFPNPSKDYLYINEIDLNMISRSYLINQVGVKTEVYSFPIDLSTLSRGVYYLSIILNSNESITKKIIKL